MYFLLYTHLRAHTGPVTLNFACCGVSFLRVAAIICTNMSSLSDLVGSGAFCNSAKTWHSNSSRELQWHFLFRGGGLLLE